MFNAKIVCADYLQGLIKSISRKMQLNCNLGHKRDLTNIVDPEINL